MTIVYNWGVESLLPYPQFFAAIPHYSVRSAWASSNNSLFYAVAAQGLVV